MVIPGGRRLGAVGRDGQEDRVPGQLRAWLMPCYPAPLRWNITIYGWSITKAFPRRGGRLPTPDLVIPHPVDVRTIISLCWAHWPEYQNDKFYEAVIWPLPMMLKIARQLAEGSAIIHT